MTNTTHHPNTTTTRPVFCQADEGESVQQLRAGVTIKLPVGATEGGRVSAAEFLLPTQFGPPLHIHDAEDELVQILEGSVRFVCGDTDEILGPGGFAYLPRGVPHTFWVQGNTPARLLAVFTPGGVEALFTSPPESFDALTAQFKVEHVGPPLGA